MGPITLTAMLCLLMGTQGQAKETYRAAVVTLYARELPTGDVIEEHTDSYLAKMIEGNVKIYENFIKEAGKKKVDILVFPEATMNYFGTINKRICRKFALTIPSVKEKVAPCDSKIYGETLARLCKAVKLAKVYTVVNVVEKVDCKVDRLVCGGKGDTNLFNTNIAFDRNGVIIARYRKVNIFNEEMMDPPVQDEFVTFSTDFGETFSTVVCFDLIFKRPTIDAINNGVTNIILSTMWFSKTPFLVAPQAQMGLAVGSNVNLLAANGIWLSHGTSGTGIYSGGKGALQMYMGEKNEDKMLVADVPKIKKRSSQNEIINYGNLDGISKKLPKQRTFKNELKNLKITQHAFPRMKTTVFVPIKEQYKICPVDDAALQQCCTYDLKFTKFNLNKAKGESGYNYYFASFSDQRQFGGKRGLGELFCAVVACTGSNPEKDCGQRFPAKISTLHTTVAFESLKITMTTELRLTNTTLDQSILVMPSTLNFQMFPLQANQYKFTSGISKNIKTNVIETRNNDDLYTFGFYGRNFNKDGSRALPRTV